MKRILLIVILCSGCSWVNTTQPSSGSCTTLQPTQIRRAKPITAEQFDKCIAIEALKDDPSMTRNQFEYLMRFQVGYEGTALGHETVMYAWKKKGRMACRLRVLEGKQIPMPHFKPLRENDVACNKETDVACLPVSEEKP